MVTNFIEIVEIFIVVEITIHLDTDMVNKIMDIMEVDYLMTITELLEDYLEEGKIHLL